jgi:hypothetical protein
MKIQFIIVGWHFNKFPELIESLIELNGANENIDIFWSCHREPDQIIKDNFNYKVFPNLGLEDGAYQQALDYLDISDDTILFLMHDDIVVKDWNFMNMCLRYLSQGYAFVGNGINYPLEFNPYNEFKSEMLNIDGTYVDIVKPEARHICNDQILFTLTLRESFICTTRKYLRDIFDFEVIWQEPIPDENGKYHIGAIGNAQQTLLGYKITKIYGPERIAYLSNTYQDSEFMYECARGGVQ